MLNDGQGAGYRRAIIGLFACTMLTAPAIAATIRGKVVDQAKGSALPGATLRIAGSGVSTVSKRDGSFVLDNAPDGATVVVDYVGYDEASTPAGAADLLIGLSATADDKGEIVVTGTRLAERRALQTKKSADNAVEALYANDVGKLPDQNVAEAVRRLPGVSVANDQGEGRYVVIRGVSPNLVNVTLNGQTLPAPEPDSRQVKLDDIPSALISAVIVTKSLLPDQDANAIGGEVNIRTLSAFDRNKPFFADARGAAGRYNLNHKTPYEGDAQVGGLLGAERNFGAVLSVNYSKRPIESENFQGTTTYNAAGQPDQFGLRDYNLVRTRIGVVGNFDWQPDDSTKIFLRTSYSKFKDNEVRDQNRVDSLAFPAATPGTYTGRGSILIRRREEVDNTKSAQLGGTFDVAGGHLETSGTYTRAIKNDPLRSEYNFRTSSTTAITGTYDLTQSPYLFTFSAPFNPANFPLNSVNYDKRHAQEDLWQLRADYTLPIDLGDSSTIKVGGKYLNRHKTNNRDYQQYSRGTTFNASAASYISDTNFYDGEFVFGPRVDYTGLQAYAAANPTALVQSASNINSSRNNSQVNDYDVREKITAGYAMAKLKFGNLTVLPGVRVERTQDNQKAKLIASGNAPIDQAFNSFTGDSYTDVFPGINAHYDFNQNFIVRGAVTTALGRPNYPDLAPYVSVDTTTSPTSITLGNPGLKRYKAVNVDASAEYYLPSQGVLSVGVFYKHIDNPIYTQSLTGQSGTFGGQAFTGVTVTQAINANDAVVHGIEANAQVQFSFLPAPLDGFGASANYAHITGHSTDLPGRVGNAPLFLQSRNVGTLQLFYEKYGLAVRAAYSFRSAYLDVLGGDSNGDQFTGYNGQLDVHASYQIAPAITVFADGSNLNDAPWRRYLGRGKNFLIERERYDYSLRGGVQLHF